MAVQVLLSHTSSENSFTYKFPMEIVPRVGEYIDLQEQGGEYKVRKIVWREISLLWTACIELRKPFSSEI